ncbi:MAG: 6-phosphogluconolactonase [Candidatus Dormibacteraeota bacterium]|uniref:6-phosphogluconolactonase n=1 Tax=Candidatus Aeolococcus gillhamiae TaxID=3127015 RepID=A0A2W5ZJP1_9BACT|nr:6-phosphogluconolactonase [Candidatus Dormibacteraeota bacterium]PZR83066.1 MAG: 6-phosphogluconolactonase [Candidatus Dormibacter sp. RRmetagenome_bin12]
MSSGELPGEVRVLTDPIAVAAEAAGWIARLCRDVERFRIAVTGGNTPHFLYEALASSTFRTSIDWQHWHVYWGDERAVPPDDGQSNYRLVVDTLLSKVPVPSEHVHRMEAERPDLQAVAADYARLLEEECGRPPRLDVVLLGLGSDGHTASLFPGTAALSVADTWATPSRATYPPYERLTLTLPALNAAASVAFVVTGAPKADALRGVIDGTVPAARVRPDNGELVWFLDAAAARSIG